MMEFVFLDLDDTILDFHQAEAIAVAKAFRGVGVEPKPTLIARYSQVNKRHWQMLERGELTREQVLVQRFACLFAETGLKADPVACKTLYEDYLSMGHYFIPGAVELLEYLAPKYRLYLASNGTARVQAARLDSSGIRRYFSDIFISQEMGADKPGAVFFQRCFARIPGFSPDRGIIIGDSLTSDIRGGNNAGLKTCWFNPHFQPVTEDVKIDWEIHALGELKGIL